MAEVSVSKYPEDIGDFSFVELVRLILSSSIVWINSNDFTRIDYPIIQMVQSVQMVLTLLFQIGPCEQKN